MQSLVYIFRLKTIICGGNRIGPWHLIISLPNTRLNRFHLLHVVHVMMMIIIIIIIAIKCLVVYWGRGIMLLLGAIALIKMEEMMTYTAAFSHR
jgi:hypothetical protein